MSIILYGPQGSGKTTIAERLRAKLKLRRVIEQDSPDFPRNLWAALSDPKHAPRIKAMNALLITNDSPPPFIHENRRVLHISQAQRMLTSE